MVENEGSGLSTRDRGETSSGLRPNVQRPTPSSNAQAANAESIREQASKSEGESASIDLAVATALSPSGA